MLPFRPCFFVIYYADWFFCFVLLLTVYLSIHLLAPSLNGPNCWSRAGPKPETRFLFWALHIDARLKTWAPAPSHAHRQTTASEMEQLGLKRMPIWDSGVAGSGFPCNPRALVSGSFISPTLHFNAGKLINKSAASSCGILL